MTRRVLVTGASGFVGSALIPVLLEQQWQVRVLTRARDNVAAHSWRHQVEIVTGDLQYDTNCHSVLRDMDTVVHLAGLAHVSATVEQHQQENFGNTRNLARAATENGVKRFVFISSCKARYPTHSAYGYFKQQSEKRLLAMQTDMEVVCLRPGIIYGEGMRNNLATLLRVLSKPHLPVGIASDRVLSMISRQDCCLAIARALEHPAAPGQVWELSDGLAYTLTDLVVNIRKQLGFPAPTLVLPQWLVGNSVVRMLATIAAALPPLRRKGLGTSTFQALFEENYPVEPSFAQTTGIHPTTTLYDELPRLLAPDRTAAPAR